MKTKEELICEFVEVGKTLYDRGYATGSAGNMSVLLPDNTVAATPTGSCLGKLDPNNLSIVDMDGNLLSGPKATKEVLFHLALYKNNPDHKAVVHLHCSYCTAYSCISGLNKDSVFKPITPYLVMRMGDVPLISYYKPGSPNLTKDIGALANKHNAFLMANHGMITCGQSLNEALCNVEELEASCKLYFILRGTNEPIKYLTADEINELRK